MYRIDLFHSAHVKFDVQIEHVSKRVKFLPSSAPSNLRTYPQVREDGTYILRGNAKLKPPAVRTATFGLHSLRHLAPNARNKLLGTTRKADTLSTFKHKLKQFKNN